MGYQEVGLRIKLFGRFEVWRQGSLIQPREWGRRKAKSLLKLLLIKRGQVFTTDQLIEALYNNSDPNRASKNLRTQISRLRRALEPDLKKGRDSHYILRVSKEHYCFNHRAPCWLDVEEFEKHLKAALTLSEAKNWSQALKHFQHSINLYRGDFLADDQYEEWSLASRERYRELHLTALERSAECHAQLGHYFRAIESVRQVLELSPTRESACGQLMLYYYYLGDQKSALRVYQACARALRKHLHVKPLSETQELYERIRNHRIPRPATHAMSNFKSPAPPSSE